MKESNKIYLANMRDRLQRIQHYDDPVKAFTDLLHAFAHYKKYRIGWAGSIRRQGWMSAYLAHEFAKYVGYPIDKN